MLGERRIQSTGQREGSVASRSSGQTGTTFRTYFELSIAAIALAADRWLGARFGQPLAIANADAHSSTHMNNSSGPLQRTRQRIRRLFSLHQATRTARCE
jgi:hypothetical protein